MGQCEGHEDALENRDNELNVKLDAHMPLFAFGLYQPVFQRLNPSTRPGSLQLSVWRRNFWVDPMVAI